MDFQLTYDNVQTQIKNKFTEIEAKQKEISQIEAEIYKLQGASEMLIVISNELQKEKQDEAVIQDEIDSETKEVKIIEEKPVKNKRITKK